jgi:hypothetical protein
MGNHKYPLELVEWKDAHNDQDGWVAGDDVEDAIITVYSVGWVVKETENNVTLAMDLCEDEDTHTRGRIPKGMIVSRKVLT